MDSAETLTLPLNSIHGHHPNDRRQRMGNASELHIRPYQVSDQAAVVALWQACGLTRPWNDPIRDIERKLAVQRDLFLVATAGSQLVASAMVGYDGHRGWVNYLAVHPQCQGRGFGRELMAYIEARLLEMGCPKLNLQVRSGNAGVIGFYQRLGYGVDETVSMGKRLIPDI